MTLAMQIVPITDAIAKLLTANSGLGVAQVAWARLAVGTLFLLPLGASSLPLRSGKRAVWHALRPHWLRGTCWAGASLFFFAAIKDNPLPNALALIFIAPLFVTITAPLLLGEAFSFRCVRRRSELKNTTGGSCLSHGSTPISMVIRVENVLRR